MHGHEAVKTARLDDVQPRFRHPTALLISGGDDAVGPHAETVGIAETCGDDLQLAAVGHDLQQHAPVWRAFGAADEIKVAVRIGLETGGVRVPASADHDVVIKSLIKIRLAVLVVIVQPRDLIAPEHIHLILHHTQSQRLVQPRGKPMPLHRLQLRVDSCHPPNIPMRRGHITIAIAREVMSRREE